MSTNNAFAGMKLDGDGYLVMQDRTQEALRSFALDLQTQLQAHTLLSDPSATALKQDIGGLGEVQKQH
ncbi:MAG UNVERIFIED_CONTAM: hypothetical protein LVQ98_00230 [Rickettsiaceae bacterium]|jgi:hypothetical protein